MRLCFEIRWNSILLSVSSWDQNWFCWSPGGVLSVCYVTTDMIVFTSKDWQCIWNVRTAPARANTVPVQDWHSRQTLLRFLCLSWPKALGGNLNPQRPLQIRFGLQSSHTYMLLATRRIIFLLFCPHLEQAGNLQSRQTLCTFLFALRPNADGGKPQSQGSASKNRMSDRLFYLDVGAILSFPISHWAVRKSSELGCFMEGRWVGVFVHES